MVDDDFIIRMVERNNTVWGLLPGLSTGWCDYTLCENGITKEKLLAAVENYYRHAYKYKISNEDKRNERIEKKFAEYKENYFCEANDLKDNLFAFVNWLGKSSWLTDGRVLIVNDIRSGIEAPEFMLEAIGPTHGIACLDIRGIERDKVIKEGLSENFDQMFEVYRKLHMCYEAQIKYLFAKYNVPEDTKAPAAVSASDEHDAPATDEGAFPYSELPEGTLYDVEIIGIFTSFNTEESIDAFRKITGHTKTDAAKIYFEVNQLHQPLLFKKAAEKQEVKEIIKKFDGAATLRISPSDKILEDKSEFIPNPGDVSVNKLDNLKEGDFVYDIFLSGIPSERQLQILTRELGCLKSGEYMEDSDFLKNLDAFADTTSSSLIPLLSEIPPKKAKDLKNEFDNSGTAVLKIAGKKVTYDRENLNKIGIREEDKYYKMIYEDKGSMNEYNCRIIKAASKEEAEKCRNEERDIVHSCKPLFNPAAEEA